VDRCALFVDAGYLLADGAMAVHGTHRRESVTWDYPGLLHLLANLAMERSRTPLLRCYWYDSTVEGRRTPDHDALADLPGVKLRLAKMRPGRREGVEGEIHRDLTTLARNKAVSDAMVITGEEDLAEVIADVQDMGMRVTLLHIASDGNTEIPRALRQECDDIVEINVAQLRPYAELIAGAEPPRQGEREGGVLALRAGGNGGNGGNGNGNGGSNGNGNGLALAARVARPSAPQAGQLASAPPAGSGNGQQAQAPAPAPSYTAAEAAQYPPPEAAAQPEFTPAEFAPPELASPELGAGRRADGVAEYAPLEEYGTPADYGAHADYRAPLGDYGSGLDSGPSFPDFTPAMPGASSSASSASAPIAPVAPAASARDEFYAAPVAVPAAPAAQAADDLLADRPSPRLRADSEPLRPVDSGYSPGAARDQFQLETGIREPVPAGSAQVRWLPTRGPGQPGHAVGQPSLGQPSHSQPSLGQPSLGQPGQPAPSPPGAGAPGAPGQVLAGGPELSAGSGGQPIAPVVPMEQAGPGYGNRGGGYAGARSANGAGAQGTPGAQGAQGALVSPVSLVGPPPGPSVHADAGRPGTGNGGPQGQDGPGGHSGQGPQGGQGGPPESGGHPMLTPIAPAPPGGYQDAGGQAGYSGGQPGVSLADAVQSAHEEGQAFGESVARDAPALWLEAVLARKPRMPSDLEARLLQGSALPIDFLLHDEVRHALRRGFWDALERARR
jgi:uncharacterized LabA/DUF88 family protein